MVRGSHRPSLNIEGSDDCMKKPAGMTAHGHTVTGKEHVLMRVGGGRRASQERSA